MAREAKTIITAEDKSGSGIKSAINNILGLDDASKKIGKTITQAFTIAGIAAATKQLTDFGVASFKAFAEAEKAAISFNTAMSARTDVSKKAIESFNKSFSDSFGVDGVAITGMQTMLLASGRTENQIKKLMTAAQALSTATGKDLNSSVEQLNKTFGGTAGELGELIPELKKMTSEQISMGDGVDIVMKKFGHLNGEIANSADITIKKFNNAWADLQRAIGGSVATWAAPVLNGITNIITRWVDAINTMTRYFNLKKKESNRTVEEEIEFKEMQAAKMKKDIEKISIDFNVATFNDWLSRMKQLDPYSVKGKRDDQLGAMYATARDRVLGDAPKEYQQLISEIESLRKTLKPLSDTIENTNLSTLIPEEQTEQKPNENKIEQEENINNTKIAFDDYLTALRVVNNQSAAAMEESMMVGVYAFRAIQQQPGGELPDLNFNPFSGMGKIGEIITGAVQGLDGFISSLMGGIKAFSIIQQVMNPLYVIMQAMFEVLEPVINELLQPIIGILKIIGQTLGRVLAPILQALSPVIDAVASAFIWFYNSIMRPIGNAIYATVMMLVNHFLNFGDLLKNISKNILDPSKWKSGKRETDWMDLYEQGPLAEIDRDDLDEAGRTDTAGSPGVGATYAGSQPITFNFYNQGNVVGSGGLEELAILIDAILKRNARYA